MDKVQYYLERAIPELQDLEHKGVYSHDEVKSIMRKRTYFERALARRHAKKEDFLRYAEYEMNLEKLRRRRANRAKGKISISDWAGPRRVFFIFDRATRKFHGDLALWLQFLDYANSEKAFKVYGKVIASALKFLPSQPALWILAAQHELDHTLSISAARILMQRGLRFHNQCTHLWIEYGRLELIYCSKIFGRRKILQIGESDISSIQPEEKDDHQLLGTAGVAGSDADLLSLNDRQLMALQNIDENPALNGDVPLTIYQSACAVLKNDVDLHIGFYKLFNEFIELKFSDRLKNAVISVLYEQFAANPRALIFIAAFSLENFDSIPESQLPRRLGTTLDHIFDLYDKTSSKSEYTSLASMYLLSLWRRPMHQALLKAVEASVFRILDLAEADGTLSPEGQHIRNDWLIEREKKQVTRQVWHS
ncbi:U3 small nucleolar RNA-associated protein 6 [Neolecta irregularis DAH-3]|uniref:U3 small nucleolar RNA-associated protein 6 n=1 Tax=Neolecta irregularis (strain DAH-3) TaxID=1198029 RepID=A0A1U7LNR9_NEOID|nr:U3 small nucleolar RNA-associated protein 6 [Neolecta irregularis DAH-3]|eukprot:OLL24297.1 U3 small nucleolar RNA-associated protein 6 [Neolecta irregularis DAH-3]